METEIKFENLQCDLFDEEEIDDPLSNENYGLSPEKDPLALDVDVNNIKEEKEDSINEIKLEHETHLNSSTQVFKEEIFFKEEQIFLENDSSSEVQLCGSSSSECDDSKTVLNAFDVNNTSHDSVKNGHFLKKDITVQPFNENERKVSYRSRQKCSVIGCSRSKEKFPYMRFFGFPTKRLDVCYQWVKKCGDEDLLYLNEKSLRRKFVCEVHFRPEDMNKDSRTLNRSAIPLLLLKDIGGQPSNLSNDEDTSISSPSQTSTPPSQLLLAQSKPVVKRIATDKSFVANPSLYIRKLQKKVTAYENVVLKLCSKSYKLERAVLRTKPSKLTLKRWLPLRFFRY